jgi:hypothetical protein
MPGEERPVERAALLIEQLRPFVKQIVSEVIADLLINEEPVPEQLAPYLMVSRSH